MSAAWSNATDSQLRRAAALVCGFTRNERFGGGWLEPDNGEAFGPVFHPDNAPDLGPPWTPDLNRDQLARVFVAALKEIDEVEDQAVVYQDYWINAMDDPRSALCALLDLVQPLGDQQ